MEMRDLSPTFTVWDLTRPGTDVQTILLLSGWASHFYSSFITMCGQIQNKLKI